MSPVLQVLLFLTLVTVVSKGAGALSSRCGQPAVFGEVLSGLLLGPSLLNILGWRVFAPRAGGTLATIAWVCARMTLFVGLAWFLGRRYLEGLAAAASRLGVSEPLMALVVVVAFLYAFAAEYLGGVAAITGSYMAGVLFAQTSFKERIDRGIHPLAYSFFVPVFFINIGLRADVKQLLGQIPLTLFILAIAVLAKVIGCGGCAWLAGLRYEEALRVGVGMISRGEVGLIVVGYGLAHGIIGNDVFSVMVVMVLVTTMITPIWLRYVFARVEEDRAAPVFESVARVGRREDW